MTQIEISGDLPIAGAAQKGLSNYLAHAVHGVSIRSLAKTQGVHPSTVLRRVRKVELKRDDPLVDQAIDQLSASHPLYLKTSGASRMLPDTSHPKSDSHTQNLIRYLTKLEASGAFLAVASDLEDAAIFQILDDGEIRQALVLGRSDAMVLALNDWVELSQTGRMSRYRITSAGRKALKRLVAQTTEQTGFSEAPNAFNQQHIEWGTRIIDGDNFGERNPHKVNLAESPVTLLARRKGKDGKAFLDTQLVTASERLREDFELSQMGPNITQNWDSFLTGPSAQSIPDSGVGSGSSSALKRFREAMKALGPGLSDIALQCCCMQNGLEIAEKRLGWSARSGKVVLRIALQRLKQHYDEMHGAHGPMIG